MWVSKLRVADFRIQLMHYITYNHVGYLLPFSIK